MAGRTLGERWQDWQAARRVVSQEPDQQQQGGEDGEIRFHQWLVERASSDTVILRDKRIRNGQGECEIDFIVIDPRGVLVLEVKNWAGEIVQRHGNWVQIRNNKPDRVDKDVTNVLRHQRDVLKQALAREGIVLDNADISCAAVLVNPRAQVAPDLQEHPYVCTAAELDQMRGIEDLAKRYAGWDEACLSQRTINAILDVSQQWKSWDRIRLFGGRECKGDVLHISVNGRMMPLRPGRSGMILKVYWDRDVISGLLSVLFGDGVGSIVSPNGARRVLASSDCVTLQVVKGDKPSHIHLTEVTMIEFG